MSVGRNDSCPCGSGKKYKKCCEGQVPWDAILRGKHGNPFSYLKTRGKNLAFYNIIGEALQLDTLEKPIRWSAIKRACTPRAVKRIHEAIPDVWPAESDSNRIYQEERETESGLYVGEYDSESIFKGLTRHAIYSDRILLFDPFTDPRAVRSYYSPVEHPEKHGINTIQCLRLWYELRPWVEAGLVGFIKKPEDFDFALGRESLLRAKALYEDNAELKALLDAAVLEGQNSRDFKEMKEFMALSRSNEDVAQGYLNDHPDADYFEVQRFIEQVQTLRNDHPYYIDFRTSSSEFSSQLTVKSSGTSYNIAKLVATATGSHIITNIKPRWKEIELDRKQTGAELGPWTPFAKAFQNSGLSFLENVPLKHALRLRQEDRLERMRGFLRKAWSKSRSDDAFHEENAMALADELRERVAEAEDEWGKINSELAKFVTAEAGGLLIASAGGVASAGVLVGGGLLTGLGTAAAEWLRRRTFPNRYPASFFLGLK